MPLKAGEVGLAYSGASFDATGGVRPYMFQVTEGALPAGLTLSRDGVLTGSPTAAGDFSFTVQVVDSGGQANSAQDSIDIVPALQLTALKSGTIYVESGCDTVCGGFATQTGGQAPYMYAVKSGSLPPGTSLSGTALSGKFGSTGTYGFTVEATDALGAVAVVTPSFSVYSHIHFYCVAGPASMECLQGTAAYGSGLTYRCGHSSASQAFHCYGLMPFVGGAGTATSAAFKIVEGTGNSRPTVDLSPEYGVTNGTSTIDGYWIEIAAPAQVGSAWGGVVLVTIYDQALCGPGHSTYCSASAYVRGDVHRE